MKQKKALKIIGLLMSLIANGSAIASDIRNSFQNIDTVDELLALPTSKLCLGGGPTLDDIKLILLNGPLAQPMYQNDPTMARMMINKQSANIKVKINQICSSNPDTSQRKLTEEMFKDEDELCKQGAPTKDELKRFLRTSHITDEGLKKIPYEYRLVMEEGAKLKGLTLREVFIEDIATNVAIKLQKTCNNKIKPESKNIKEYTTTTNDILKQTYNEADKKLNNTWGKLSPEKRKSLLPSQRKWIKQQTICNRDIQCLINMTNKRISELETNE